jgi:hypothetical protein
MTPEPNWLWPGRIPLGKVTLLVGDPGVGKSLLALDVAARLSSGQPWPDVSQPARLPTNVLLLSAEDDLADTIRPRLEAMGADCSRITAMPPGWTPDAYWSPPEMQSLDTRPLHERPPKPLPFDLRRHLDHLHSLIRDMRGCRLVIIDPITAFLGGNVENANSEIRRLLQSLADLARVRQTAIVAISHLRKQSGAAIHRTAGCLAFVAAARAAWLVAKDPSDASRRLMLPLKNNLLAAAAPLAFTIASGGQDDQPLVRWSQDDSVPLTADEALRPEKLLMGRPADERDEAAAWLEHALAEGAKPMAQIEEQAVAYGFRATTLRRAFRRLGGEAVKIGWGPVGQWYWRLPGIGEQNPQPSSDPL